MAITDPLDITGCVLWLDPGSLTATDGDFISAWSDETVNSNDASASGAARPVYRDGTDFFHANPSLEFNTTAQRLSVAADATLDNANVTYAIVCRLDNLNANTDSSWLINKVNTNPSTVGLRIADSDIADAGLYETFFRLDGSESTVRDLESRGPYRQAWTVLLFRYDGTTGELYVDKDLTDSVSVSGSLDTDNSGFLSIGNHNSLSLAWRGRIGDVVAYDNAISNTDRDDLIDWLLDKYKNSEYTKTSSILTAGVRHARIRSAAETGLTENNMVVCGTNGDIDHYTSPINDPHNWTLANSDIIPNDPQFRTLDFTFANGVWYVYVDEATSNGRIELWTGDSLDNLTESASSPIITGSVGDYPRTPAVIEENGSWTMLVDVRTDSITGGVGYLDRYTSTDGVSWTKDAVNSPVVSATGNGFEGTDITHPQIHKAGASNYLVTYAGYNDNHPLTASFFPHELGLLTSTDLISFTRSNKNPILTMAHGSTDFDITLVANPCLWDDGTNLVLYYSGRKVNGDIQVGYATGDAPVDYARNIFQTTFSTQIIDLQTVFADAADRIFFFGAYPGPGGGPTGEIGQEATTNFTYIDIVQAIGFSGSTGYDFQADIRQYIGFTDREFANISQVVFNRGDQNPPKSAVYDVEKVSCSNVISWIDHDTGDALKEVFPVHQSIGWIESITDRGTVEDLFDQIFVTGQTVDLGTTELGEDPAQSFLRQHVSFQISNKKQTEKTYSPFIGDSDDTTFPEVPATAPNLGQGVLTLTHPRVTPTTTLVLKNPEFGNADVIRFTKVDRTTRGGDRKIFSDLGWGQTQTFELRITNICNTTATVDELIDFLNASLGEEIGLLDWENRQWKGVINVPETEITQQVEGHSVRIIFEGTLV